MRPRFYAPYESQLEQIRDRAKPLEELEKRHPESKPLLRGSECQAHGARGARPLVAGSSSQGILDRADRHAKTAGRSPTSTSIRTESQWPGADGVGSTSATQLATRDSKFAPVHSLPSLKMMRSVEASGISPRYPSSTRRSRPSCVRSSSESLMRASVTSAGAMTGPDAHRDASRGPPVLDRHAAGTATPGVIVAGGRVADFRVVDFRFDSDPELAAALEFVEVLLRFRCVRKV